MGQFMSHNGSDALFVSDGRDFLVVQQSCFSTNEIQVKTLTFFLKKKYLNVPVSNETPIFHGTGREIRNGDHVLLGQWVLDAEILFVESQNLGSDLIGVTVRTESNANHRQMNGRESGRND